MTPRLASRTTTVAHVIVLIAGALVSPLVRMSNVVVDDVLNEQPNSATLTLNALPHATVPTVGPFEADAFDAGGFATAPVPLSLPTIQAGQEIKIYQNGFTDAHLIFAGQIVVQQQFYDVQNPANVAYHLSCTDYTRALNRRKVSKSYGTQSATAIVLDLMASRASAGFTVAHVAAGLPSVAIDFTNEDMNRALTRLANRVGGYWYVDYTKDLHFFRDPEDYASAVLAGAPLAYWRLNEQSGTTCVDASGHGHHAFYDLSPGLGASSPLADGSTAVTNGRALIPGTGGPNPNDRLTAAFWFKGTDTASQFSACGPGRIVAGAGWNVNKRDVAPNGKLGVRIDTSAGTNQVKVTSNCWDGQWHFFVLTLDTGNWKWFKDGVLDTSGTYLHGTGFANAAAQFTVHNGSPYNTSIDEVAIYDRALTATDVADLYARRLDAGPPAALVPGGDRFAALTFDRDLTQVRTRVLVEAMGSQLLAHVAPGDTMIPVVDPLPFPGVGGYVVAGPQRIRYTGVTIGLGGTLIGQGAQPATAPGLGVAAGAGVDLGVHGYAITFVTASGETLPGPTGSINVGTVAPPTVAPGAGAPTAGGSVDAGAHDYVTTFVTASGETTPGPISNAVTTGGAVGNVPPPTTGPNAVAMEDSFGGPWPIGASVYCNVVFVNAAGTTTPGPNSATVVIKPQLANPSFPGTVYLDAIPVSADPTVTGKRIYWNVGGIWQGYTSHANATTLIAHNPVGTPSGGAPPATNTAVSSTKNTVPLTGIPIGDPVVTGRKLYRRFNGTGTFKLVATLADNTTTTYSDTTANASLGAAAPTSSTASANRVQVTVPLSGSASVTGRRLYRTVAGGSALKLLTTIADNTTTAFLDATADSALGAAAPTADTSNLRLPEGQVNAGATSIPLANVNAFLATGGWAVIGNGEQVIRYTGLSGATLTGIPASGLGSVRATVTYNTTITAASTLNGVPAAGDGALVALLGEGQDLNVLVIRDDLAAQAALAALEPQSDGVIEHYIQDRRLSAASAATTADAELQLFNAPEIRVRYTTRDPRTRTGRTIRINLPAPTNLVGDFLIQRVQFSQFEFPGTAPLRTVEASSTRFSFDDVLRRLGLETYS